MNIYTVGINQIYDVEIDKVRLVSTITNTTLELA